MSRTLSGLVVLLSIAVALTSCASEQLQKFETSFLFPGMDIIGAHASQWTLDDLRQVRELMRSHPDIRKPLDRIDAYARDRGTSREWQPMER